MPIRGLVFPLFAITLVTLGGCAADTAEDDAQPADDAAAEEELRSTGITQLTVGRSTGFRPPPQPGKCHASGRWTVDFAAKTIDAAACIDERAGTLRRALSAPEIARIRAAVAAVRVAPRPAACPADAPVSSLEVARGDKKFFYVEQRSACGGSRAVTSASISALIDVMSALPR